MYIYIYKYICKYIYMCMYRARMITRDGGGGVAVRSGLPIDDECPAKARDLVGVQLRLREVPLELRGLGMVLL